MIADIVEYQKAQEEIDALEGRLRDLRQSHPVGLKGFTKAKSGCQPFDGGQPVTPDPPLAPADAAWARQFVPAQPAG